MLQVASSRTVCLSSDSCNNLIHMRKFIFSKLSDKPNIARKRHLIKTTKETESQRPPDTATLSHITCRIISVSTSSTRLASTWDDKYCTIVFTHLLSCVDYTNSHRRTVPLPYNDELYRDHTSANVQLNPFWIHSRFPRQANPELTNIILHSSSPPLRVQILRR